LTRWKSAPPTRCQPDRQLIDFQILTNSLRFCVRRALRSLGLITYHSHIRSKPLTSSGISHWEASCGYLPLSVLKTPMFGNRFETRWNRWRGNMRRQMVSKFRLPLELSLDSGEVFASQFNRHVRFTPKSGHLAPFASCGHDARQFVETQDGQYREIRI